MLKGHSKLTVQNSDLVLKCISIENFRNVWICLSKIPLKTKKKGFTIYLYLFLSRDMSFLTCDITIFVTWGIDWQFSCLLLPRF